MQEGETDIFHRDVFTMLADRKSAELKENTPEPSIKEEEISKRDILRKKENEVRARASMPSEFSRMSKDRD